MKKKIDYNQYGFKNSAVDKVMSMRKDGPGDPPKKKTPVTPENSQAGKEKRRAQLQSKLDQLEKQGAGRGADLMAQDLRRQIQKIDSGR